MTPVFENILVDVDASAAVQPALEVATRLARHGGAQLRVVDVASETPARLVEDEPLAPSLRLAREAAASTANRTPAEALVEEAQRFGHDLVIRSRSRDFGAGAGVTARLFRDCPCAVWSLGPVPFGAQPRIVAAVNAGSEDAETQASNRKALATARLLAEAEDGRVTVVYAWAPPAGKKVYARASAAEYEASVAAAEARAAADLGRVAGEEAGRTELLRGDPAEAMAAFAVREGVDLIVTGTRGRSRVWQLLFGSTAERLLEIAPCSVLAVKES